MDPSLIGAVIAALVALASVAFNYHNSKRAVAVTEFTAVMNALKDENVRLRNDLQAALERIITLEKRNQL